MKTSKPRELLIALLLFASLAAAAAAKVALFQEDDGSKGKVNPLTLEHEKLHPMESFFYNENYFLIAITDAGYYGYVNLLVSNTGIKKGQPAVSFTVVTPENKRLVRDADYQPEDMKTADDSFSIRIKHNLLEKTETGYRLAVEHDGLGMELEYVNEAPGFVLGNGKAVFGESGEDWFYINYPAPRPRVKGHFMIDGEKVPVDGWGYMDHSITVSDPTNYQKTWHNMKFHSDTHTVLISSFETPKEFDKNFGHAVITDDERVLCAFTDVRVAEEGVEIEPESEKPYPKKVRYELVGDDCRASAVMDAARVTEKFDVLAKLDQKWYGRAVKMAINAFIAEPWYFRSVAPVEVKIELKGETFTVKGAAFNEIIYTE